MNFIDKKKWQSFVEFSKDYEIIERYNLNVIFGWICKSPCKFYVQYRMYVIQHTLILSSTNSNEYILYSLIILLNRQQYYDKFDRVNRLLKRYIARAWAPVLL